MKVHARQFVTKVFIGIAALVVATSAGAQTGDPIVGTWKLDVAKSTYKPGPAAKSATVVVEPAGKGIKVSVDAVGADGTPAKWGFTTQRDGKEVPVTGSALYDTASTRRCRARPRERPVQEGREGRHYLEAGVECRWQDDDPDVDWHGSERAGCSQRYRLHETVAPQGGAHGGGAPISVHRPTGRAYTSAPPR